MADLYKLLAAVERLGFVRGALAYQVGLLSADDARCLSESLAKAREELLVGLQAAEGEI